MVVLTLEKVPEGLRGELSQWMIEIATGVFVGKQSARVRDALWEKCQKSKRTGHCCQVYPTNSEQGFAIRSMGTSKRTIINAEGVYLVALKNAKWEKIYLEETHHETS